MRAPARGSCLSQTLMATALAVALGVAGTPPVNAATDPRITTEERELLVKYLRQSEDEFVALLESVSETQWRWKAAPERWSVAETATHIVIAEKMLFGLSRQAMANPADADWEAKTAGKTALLERVLPDRSRKVQAPEPLNPGSAPMTKAQVLATFREARANTLRFANTTELPLRDHLTKGLFPIFDPLNAYQFVLYIPLHNLRHNKQIAEVKADPGYPKN
jgi:hypothetical protein